jgi:retron-type reverse transcriptase
VIPPAELPRIKVIDGTMVGLGLISSEELAEIHEIGKQMDLHQNHGAVIERAAAEAVQQSRQARDRRKKEKQKEAEERRRARQEAVAVRRATDIVYLGRGVSKGLADRRSNIEKLQANQLPVLSSPADVAEAMELTIPKLRWLAWHSEAPTRVHYYYFSMPKKSGGQRMLAAPHRQLEAAQRWILDSILNRLPVHDAAHGFVTGRSVATNAEPHVGASVVVNSDLEDFFPTITFARVDGLFRSMGYSPAVATILALLCTECPRRQMQYDGTVYFAATGPRGLPQGACTSPAISNLICRRLDHRMASMAAKLKWNYTRYADDITWSATEEAGPSIGYVLARIRHISEDEGFRVNGKKTRVLRPSQRQTVTGIVVNDRLSIPRKTIRRIRAILHNARRTGLQAQNRDDHPDFAGWLQGMIAWISMVNPEQGRRLDAMFQELMP